MTDHYIMESRLAEEQKNCRSIVSGMKCPVHGLKARVTYDYDDEFTEAHLSKCCCPEFAKQVANELEKAQVIDVVDISRCEYTR
ncbi:hypothetical protein [Phocaeicola faecalis]